MMKEPETYTIKIDEITLGGHGLVRCQLSANDDEAAAAIMNDLLLSVAKHNNLSTDHLNCSMYKTQWINGI